MTTTFKRLVSLKVLNPAQAFSLATLLALLTDCTIGAIHKAYVRAADQLKEEVTAQHKIVNADISAIHRKYHTLPFGERKTIWQQINSLGKLRFILHNISQKK